MDYKYIYNEPLHYKQTLNWIEKNIKHLRKFHYYGNYKNFYIQMWNIYNALRNIIKDIQEYYKSCAELNIPDSLGECLNKALELQDNFYNIAIGERD